MELTAKVIHDVEFRMALRGYDPDEVDAFISQVERGIEALQTRVRDSEARAERAEQRAREAGENDDAIRRTLVLAQRTADQATAEAREEAAGITREAEAASVAKRAEADEYASRRRSAADTEAHRITDNATQRANQLLADAEAFARHGTEELRRRLLAEISSLEETRDRLRSDINHLEAHLTAQRRRVESSIALMQRLVDDGTLRETPVPNLSAVVLPEPVDMHLRLPEQQQAAAGAGAATAERAEAQADEPASSASGASSASSASPDEPTVAAAPVAAASEAAPDATSAVEAQPTVASNEAAGAASGREATAGTGAPGAGDPWAAATAAGSSQERQPDAEPDDLVLDLREDVAKAGPDTAEVPVVNTHAEQLRRAIEEPGVEDAAFVSNPNAPDEGRWRGLRRRK